MLCNNLQWSDMILSQSCNVLQDDVGVHLALSGCSKAGLMCGRLLGLTTHPKTILKKKAAMAAGNIKLVREKLKNAVRVSKCQHKHDRGNARYIMHITLCLNSVTLTYSKA